MEYFTLFIGAVLINNFVLTKFLGLCIFFGVFEKLERFGRDGFRCYGRYHLEYHLSLESVQLGPRSA